MGTVTRFRCEQGHEWVAMMTEGDRRVAGVLEIGEHPLCLLCLRDLLLDHGAGVTGTPQPLGPGQYPSGVVIAVPNVVVAQSAAPPPPAGVGSGELTPGFAEVDLAQEEIDRLRQELKGREQELDRVRAERSAFMQAEGLIRQALERVQVEKLGLQDSVRLLNADIASVRAQWWHEVREVEAVLEKRWSWCSGIQVKGMAKQRVEELCQAAVTLKGRVGGLRQSVRDLKPHPVTGACQGCGAARDCVCAPSCWIKAALEP